MDETPKFFIDTPIEPNPVIDAYKAGIDISLIRRSLQFSYEERLRNLMEMQRFADELRRAGRKARGEE